VAHTVHRRDRFASGRIVAGRGQQGYRPRVRCEMSSWRGPSRFAGCVRDRIRL